MQTYRQYVDSKYSVRQILVEHHHFNDPVKSAHIRALLLRCREQNAIPIINYNDAVSQSENRRMEIAALAKSQAVVHECIDNDETAALVAWSRESADAAHLHERGRHLYRPERPFHAH